MDLYRIFGLLGVLSLGVAGCAQSAAPLPPVGQITAVRLTVTRPPGAAGPAAPCAVKLTAPGDITPVLDWLKGIDWSEEGQDLAVVRLPAPDGSVEVLAKDGSSSAFDFFWDGRVVYRKANRLLKGADTEPLRLVAKRVCK